MAKIKAIYYGNLTTPTILFDGDTTNRNPWWASIMLNGVDISNSITRVLEDTYVWEYQFDSPGEPGPYTDYYCYELEINFTGTSVPNYAFTNVDNLLAANLSDDITHIGDQAFYSVNPDQGFCLTIGSGCTTLGREIFAFAHVENIVCKAQTAPTPSTAGVEPFKSMTGSTPSTESPTGDLYYPAGSDYSSWRNGWSWGSSLTAAGLPSGWTFYSVGDLNDYSCVLNGTGGITPSGSTSGDTSGSTSGDTSGSTSGDTSGETTVATDIYSKYGGLTQNVSGNPSSALPYAIAVEFNPSDADIDAEVTFGHNDLFGSNYSVRYSHGDYSVARVYLELNAGIDGYSDVTIRDRNSNLSTTVRVYNCPAGSQSSPRAYFSPSAATFSSAACSTGQSYLDKKIGDLVCVGFNVATVGRSSSYIPSNTSDWWNISGARPLASIAADNTFYVVTMGENSGSTRDINGFYGIQDTNVNFYVLPFYIVQEGSGSTPTPPIPSGSTVDSGSTSHTITYSGCPLVFDHSASTGTWNTLPTVTTGGTTDNWSLTYDVPANDTDSARTITYYYLRYSGETCEDLVDTVSYTISQSAGTSSSGETPYVYVDPISRTVSSDAGVVEFNVYAVNCTFTGAGLTLVSSSVTGDWSSGPAYIEHVKVSDNHMIVRVAYPQNTSTYRSINFDYNALTDYGDQGISFIFAQNAYAPSPGEISATSITLNVASAITGSGIATTTVNPSDATVNLRYTSSNSTIATIDQNGRITVVRNGQVTICVKDLITGLQDCKTIRVTKGSSGGDDDDLIYVYTGITVNDNEGHRYNITAEPGYKYGCLGKTYKTVNACEARYSLYYINAYGGVDVLPCKGKSSMKKDNITRYNYSRTFRNNTLEFENTNYLSEIKTTWELHTGYMVDTQSEKMHHLVESTCVFLYDALEQTYTPVVMTDKTLEYKTFHNQGRTFYNYTINIEESQSKERR